MDIIKPESTQEETSTRREEIERSDFVPPREKSGGVFYLVIGIIAIIVSVAASVFVLYGDKLPSLFSSSDASPTATASVTETASPTASETVSASESATTSATTSITNYSSKKLRIVNGNGITGEAASVKSTLEKAGFTIESTGNASKTYEKTTIYYNGDANKDFAEALGASLPTSYRNAEFIKSETVSGVYDAIIALGNKAS